MKITSIKTQLIVTIMVASLVSLFIACVIYSFYDLSRYQSAKERELKQLVQLISPLLIQELDSSAKNTNQGLWKQLVAENKGVQSVVLYRLNSTVFDAYVSPLSRGKQLAPDKGVKVVFSGDYCLFNAPLRSNKTIVGYIAVDYYLFDRLYGFRSILLVFVSTSILATIIAYFISSFLQLQFNKSIDSLVEVARSICLDKNYTARGVKHADDEFGLLTDAINEMLDEISRREIEMQSLNDHLEVRVDTRTVALQEINARLLNEKIRADQASLIKSDFLANMSHEIRTPMNGIVASCDLAVAEELSPKVANYLKIIQASSHTLLLIINDILDFSQLEAGTLELEEAAFSLSELLCKLGGFFQEKAQHKNIELTLEVDSKTPDILVGDRGRFQQILGNLLDNGIKFTHEGKVSLNIVCLEKKDDSVIVECQIRDTGVGLSEENMSDIFQSFHQIDSSTTRQFGGTGLGLAITKKLATMMGGTIEVISDLGQGSSFVVIVKFGWNHTPLSLVTTTGSMASLPVGCQSDLLGRHVLLAENDETNCGIGEAMLTGFGLTVDSVITADLVLQALEVTEYDFVIIDMLILTMDGSELIQKIRSQSKFQDLIIVVMTDHSYPGDKDKYLQVGANGYLTKPLIHSRVLAVLCSLCNGGQGSVTDVASPQRQSVIQDPVILDIGRATKKLGVDIDVYKKVLGTFYFDYEDVEVDFIKAQEDGDLDWIKKKIHSLKGASATIGAEKLTTLVTAMDLQCKDGILPGEEQIRDILFQLEQVRKEAKQFVKEQASQEQKNDEGLTVINNVDLEERFKALAQALDESLYDQINNEIRYIEENITGSKVDNLVKIIRMYAYDDALTVLSEIAEELSFSIDKYTT